MRRFLTSCTAFAALSLMLCQPLAAQEKEQDKDKGKAKIQDNEEIIIKRKGDKDSKVTIEIKGDEVTVNGKPLAEFDDENIVIKKGRTIIYGGSPFRGQSGTLSLGEDHTNLFSADKSAVLGVYTDDDKKGARIEKVTAGSSADKAGLKEDDVITKVDDVDIKSPDGLSKAISKHKPEDKVTIIYERDGKTNKTEATLGKRKSRAITYSTPHFEGSPNFNFDWKEGDWGPRVNINNGKPKLGIKAQDTDDGKGVKVLSVDDESAAEKAGVEDDDIILEFDGKKVNSAEELANAAKEAKDKPAVKIVVSRNGKTQTLEVKTPKKLKTATL